MDKQRPDGVILEEEIHRLGERGRLPASVGGEDLPNDLKGTEAEVLLTGGRTSAYVGLCRCGITHAPHLHRVDDLDSITGRENEMGWL